MIKTLVYLKILVLFAATFVFACSEEEAAPTENGDDTEFIQKSSKRGLSYNLTNPLDFDSLKAGVSWWYNWYYKTTAPEGYYKDYEMEFIPMLWGHNPSNDYVQVKEVILNNPEIKYLLVMNEPNLTDQVNMLPVDAAREWVKYEQVAADLESQGREIYIVGPAMNSGTLPDFGDPVVWLDAFYEAYRLQNNGNDPRIDYLAFHWYDYGLEAQLNRLTKYGKKIWITEMANWNPVVNTYEKQAQQMTEMVALCEARDDVFRYAWFIGRGEFPDEKFTYLFTANPGELNMLGRLYLSLPY